MGGPSGFGRRVASLFPTPAFRCGSTAHPQRRNVVRPEFADVSRGPAGDLSYFGGVDTGSPRLSNEGVLTVVGCALRMVGLRPFPRCLG